MKPIIPLLTIGAACFAQETVRHATVGPEDVVQLNTGVFMYSSIVLPEGEKAINFFCGDPKHFDVVTVEGAERFVLVKPTPGAHPTTLQIPTDHNNNYTIKVNIQSPVDAKLFLDSTNVEALRKPPTFVPAAEALKAKSDLAATQAELERVRKETQAEIKRKADALQLQVPHSLHFDYSFEPHKSPFNIEAVWHDDRFTYIRADGQEVAGVYDLKDGRPNLLQVDYNAGLYTIRAVLDTCELRLGKQKTVITKRPGA